MPIGLMLVVALCGTPAAKLPTELWPVAPDPAAKAWWLVTERSKDRAVILLPGLKLHPLRPNRVTRPEMHDWQEGGSELVTTLARSADVFAFGYAQTVSLDVVAHSWGLRAAVARVKGAGYGEVVLVGHSAGGVIARLFAENYPDAGVTKVILVAAPNAGSELAAVFKTGYPKVQAPFVMSLAPVTRKAARPAPHAAVPMACVVCKLPRLGGDGVVPLASQWPDDLRRQGVPAAVATVSHTGAMRGGPAVPVIADLARGTVARWSPGQVEEARKVLFGDLLIRPRK